MNTLSRRIYKTSLTVEHNRADAEVSLHHRAHIAGLFLELSHRAHLGGLIRVDESGRDFDDGCVDGRAPLLLQEDPRRLVWVGWILEDGQDAHAVDV
jgi:hypothetical protein